MAELTKERRDEIRLRAHQAVLSEEMHNSAVPIENKPPYWLTVKTLDEFHDACGPDDVLSMLDGLDAKDAEIERLRYALNRIHRAAFEEPDNVAEIAFKALWPVRKDGD